MALTADTPLVHEIGQYNDLPVAASTKIYEGAMVGDNGSGYMRGLVAGDPFRGHCVDQADNSSGAAGAINARILTGRYRLQVTITSVAITDVGRKVYGSADGTYTLTAGSNTCVGKVYRYVTTNTAIVEFETSPALDFFYVATVAGEENIATLDLTFAGTGGPKRGCYFKGEITGAAHCNYGMFKFRTYLNAAAAATCHTICANLHLKDAAELTDSGEWASSPLYVTVETEVTSSAPDLSGGSLAGIYFGYYVDESGGAPAKAYLFQTNNHASYNWDGMLRMSAGDLGDTASGGDEASHVVGFDGDGTTRKIPILIDSTTYYILVGTAIQNVADA